MHQIVNSSPARTAKSEPPDLAIRRSEGQVQLRFRFKGS